MQETIPPVEYTRIVQSGRMLEIYDYEKRPNPGKKPTTRAKKKSLQEVSYPKIRTQRSYIRAKNNFRRMVRANLSIGAPSFVTLTMVTVESIEVAYREFSQFTVNIRKSFGSSISWVSVPEFQERGAVHFHSCFWGLPDDVVFNEAPWSSYAGQSKRQSKRRARFVAWAIARGFDPRKAVGTRDIQACWSRGWLDVLGTDGSPKIASYMAKYMSKQMRDARLGGKKSYSASRNALRPVLLNTRASVAEIERQWPEIRAVDSELDLFESDRVYSTEWLGRCRYRRLLID